MKNRKPRKIKNPETSRTYKEREREVLQSFAFYIYPCEECNNPVPSGYCCPWCGHDDSDDHGFEDNA